MKTTKRHMWWARLSIAALLGVTLIAAGEVWSATHSQPNRLMGNRTCRGMMWSLAGIRE